ncbi:sulfurtransferase [Bordetella genomosp. 5]|uniref:rhodanese-like domain-containing protein n=1 Tax=Bordetella genomosp. 5 TaxID=1395608 RepID=UPI000B9E6747|nr:rhodanese-like domain-containing protein [Bordetella genomosp. 5]OZI33666.1 sulfurtransferase [Bordetella genomosp. 5]
MTNSNPPDALATVDAATLKQWLHDGGEIALLDVREHGQYGEGHLFYAVPLPYSRLEIEAPRLLPSVSVRAVVYDDDGEGVSGAAARALRSLGYAQVQVLQGGVSAWRDAGYAVFAGVNVPSKTFGELAELALHTPRISAQDLAERQARGDNLVVLDGRPLQEFAKMSIPGAICCPNGELALRAERIAPDPATTIVVNCAGRTRSIIGAQTLINLGVPNPVYALENGTQGWYLADLPLEHGKRAAYPAEGLEGEALERQRARAQDLARTHGVAEVDAETATAWLSLQDRSTYLCDVRTPEEFAAGSLPGAQHTPGGQLIQATDQFVAARGARLVLFDAEGVRAPVVASWLRQLGWDAYVLKEGVRADVRASRAARPVIEALPEVRPAALAQRLEQGARVIDVRGSMAYRAAHLRGAEWAIRPGLARPGLTRPGLAHAAIPSDTPVVFVADDPAVAALAGQALREGGHGGEQAWLRWDAQALRDAGAALDASPDAPPDAQCIDYLFFVHDRHDGNKDAARQYLAWEVDLVSRIDAAERAAYRLPASA